MRNFISLVLAFAIIIAVVPLVGLMYKDEIMSVGTGIVEQNDESPSEKKEETTTKTQPKEIKADTVKVLLSKTKKIDKVSLEYYVISVLAKEIDINSPDEALKAQAVCIYTFLLHAKESANSKNYDITDDSSIHQSYLSKSDLKKYWAGNYDANYAKLKKIADSVYGKYLTYNSEIILSAYHSSNAGMTESSKNYWGSDYPYLTSVISMGDKLCSEYANEVKFTPKELKNKLMKMDGKKFIFPQSPSDWIGEKKITPSKTVMKINIGSEELTGREVREALGLKSSFFTTEYKNGNFIFITSGYGHGVGLSQEGAKYMAKIGFSYKDILLHYYNGVEISEKNNV